MLKSAADQTVKFPFHIGISFETPEIRQWVLQTLKLLCAKLKEIHDVKLLDTVTLHVYREKHPQFIRYRKLWNRINKDDKNISSYVIFSDDDDLWAPQRSESFREIMKAWKQHDLENPGIVSHAMLGVYFAEPAFSTINHDNIHTWKQVLEMKMEIKTPKHNIPTNYIDMVRTFFSMKITQLNFKKCKDTQMDRF